MTASDEQQWAERAASDPAAFGLLYDRYVNRIYAFVHSQTHDASLAADVTSTTFELALRNIRRYRWQGHSFGAWLYRIARNELARYYRRERLLQPLTHLWPSTMDLERAVQDAELRDAVQLALARLPRADREILSLRFFEELTSEEVATILDCSTSNVYVRVHRALRRLRAQLDTLESKGVLHVTE